MAPRKSKSQHSSKLIDALKFIGMSGSEYCSIGNNQITAFTNQIAMGHPIEEDLSAHADIKMFLKSLTKSDDNTSITLFDEKVHVNSGNLQVFVNCAESIKHITPDIRHYALGQDFVEGLTILNKLVSGHGEEISLKTVLCNGQSMFATNRYVLVEYWQSSCVGSFNISKKMIDLVIKSKKLVQSLGYSEHSVTVYFVDSSWIMGPISKESWINPIMPTKNAPPVDTAFKTACSSVLPFCDANLAYCQDGHLLSHPGATAGASYPVEGLPQGALFGSKDLAFVAQYADKIDWSDAKKVTFYGSNLRGMLCDRSE